MVCQICLFDTCIIQCIYLELFIGFFAVNRVETRSCLKLTSFTPTNQNLINLFISNKFAQNFASLHRQWWRLYIVISLYSRTRGKQYQFYQSIEKSTQVAKSTWFLLVHLFSWIVLHLDLNIPIVTYNIQTIF